MSHACIVSIFLHLPNLFLCRPHLKINHKTPGGGKRTIAKFVASTAMREKDRHDLNRRYVIMCAIDMRQEHMAQQRGFKLFLGKLSPEYATCPMNSTTFNNTLTDICGEVKNDVIEQLRKQRQSCMDHGYEGPFCGVQVDLTSAGRVKYCTASVSIIPPDFGGRRHLALGTRLFRGRHTFPDIRLWLQEVTIAVFWLNSVAWAQKNAQLRFWAPRRTMCYCISQQCDTPCSPSPGPYYNYSGALPILQRLVVIALYLICLPRHTPPLHTFLLPSS